MSWVVDSVTANVVALIGSITVIVMWMAPIIDVWIGKNSIFKTRGEHMPASSLAYVAGFWQCTLWVMYLSARGDNGMVALLTNACGLALNLSFTACFWFYSSGQQRGTIKREFVLLFILFLLAVIIWAAAGNNDGVGYIAMLVNIAMYYGPLAATKDIIKMRSARTLPLAPILLQLINSTIWTAWAVYVRELPIAIPNVLGVLFALILTGLWIWANRQDRLNSIGESTPGIGDVEFEPVSGYKTHAGGL